MTDAERQRWFAACEDACERAEGLEYSLQKMLKTGTPDDRLGIDDVSEIAALADKISLRLVRLYHGNRK